MVIKLVRAGITINEIAFVRTTLPGDAGRAFLRACSTIGLDADDQDAERVCRVIEVRGWQWTLEDQEDQA